MMKERITTVLSGLPARIVGLSVAFGALAGAAGVGWAGRGTLGTQMELPGEVAAFEVRVDSALDSLGARIDSTSAQVAQLVRSQARTTRGLDRLSERLDRLICLLAAESQGIAVYGCETGP